MISSKIPPEMYRELVPENTVVLFMEDLENGQHNIDLDGEIGQQVARQQHPPVIRLWRSANQTGIAVSRKDVATPAAKEAQRIIMEEGLDVVVRQTGGTAVPQGPGVLHISFLLPRVHESRTTDDYYRLLCGPLIDYFGTLGLEAETGALQGSYCDGTYNVLIGHKKLVGTAQAWRGGLAGISSRHPGYILAHANLVVEYDLVLATRRINHFYELAQETYRVNENASTSLQLECPGLYQELTAAEKARQVGLDLAAYYRSIFML
ncbi:ligase [Alicyclobacillus sp. SO9]|uniref:lipoate--protein ligase family protein n=1 Tax=Alicyclobacillus sp. SO9 TaxID=2665646 RepID=UPI0018E84786|nr:ligase [Alicyclobacillus sp. SO9]QQE77785.1 ligase [Alicyclobacillus sp. SO9]